MEVLITLCLLLAGSVVFDDEENFPPSDLETDALLLPTWELRRVINVDKQVTIYRFTSLGHQCRQFNLQFTVFAWAGQFCFCLFSHFERDNKRITQDGANLKAGQSCGPEKVCLQPSIYSGVSRDA